jgi:hypothetical protein
MPTWQSFTESLVILVLLSELRAEFFFNTLCLAQLYKTRQSFHLQLCLLSHSLASKVFSNLEVFPDLLIPALVPYHVFV